jgi:hypothetical protein
LLVDLLVDFACLCSMPFRITYMLCYWVQKFSLCIWYVNVIKISITGLFIHAELVFNNLLNNCRIWYVFVCKSSWKSRWIFMDCTSYVVLPYHIFQGALNHSYNVQVTVCFFCPSIFVTVFICGFVMIFAICWCCDDIFRGSKINLFYGTR